MLSSSPLVLQFDQPLPPNHSSSMANLSKQQNNLIKPSNHSLSHVEQPAVVEYRQPAQSSSATCLMPCLVQVITSPVSPIFTPLQSTASPNVSSFEESPNTPQHVVPSYSNTFLLPHKFRDINKLITETSPQCNGGYYFRSIIY